MDEEKKEYGIVAENPGLQRIETKPHPIQDLNFDEHGTLRFRENKIVRDVLDFSSERGFSMNQIAVGGYSRADRVQFAQLIGYSLGGFGDLSYVNGDDYAAATAKAESGNNFSELKTLEARNEFLQDQLKLLQDGVKTFIDTVEDAGIQIGIF